MTVSLRHTQSGVLKSAPVGFSWTTLFCSGFPALFRGDLKWAVIMWIVEGSIAVLSIFAVGIPSVVVHVVFAAIYNKRYIVDLMAQGFAPADDHSRNVLAQKGIAILGGPVSQPTAEQASAPAAVQPAPPVVTPKRQNLEDQILGAARSRGGVLTPADVAMETECNLDKAKQQLEDLVTRGHVELRARRNGDLVYAFPSLLDAEQREALEPLA